MPNHFRGTVCVQYPLLVPGFVCQRSLVLEVVNKRAAYGYNLVTRQPSPKAISGN